MNRDWFARTQVETDTKLELLRRYPGMLYVDGHEMGGNHYFFPPTADPTYHEITSESMRWQDFLYGDALAAEFKRQHISFFTNKVFDFFAMVYGDTVPATAFSAAGMTFEKANFDPIAQRTYEHYVTHWVSISQGALNREDILHDWHGDVGGGVPARTRRRARAQRGERPGQHRPARGPEREGTTLLPAGRRPGKGGRGAAARPAAAADGRARCYRLTAPLAVPDFKPYGRPAGAERCCRRAPTGSRWRRCRSTGSSPC